jgi:hypothetical protein
LRLLARHRAELIRHRAPHFLHMQQALKQMNIQLSEVLSDREPSQVPNRRTSRTLMGEHNWRALSEWTWVG